MFLLKVVENPATRRFLTRCIVSGGRKLTVGNEDYGGVFVPEISRNRLKR